MPIAKLPSLIIVKSDLRKFIFLGKSFDRPILCTDHDDADCLKLVIVTARERIRGTFRSVVKVGRKPIGSQLKIQTNYPFLEYICASILPYMNNDLLLSEWKYT